MNFHPAFRRDLSKQITVIIFKKNTMLQNHITKQKITIIFLMLIFAVTSGYSQDVKRIQPKWWFGESLAANFNYYDGTTQMLNNNLAVPTAFHKAYGVKPYASFLIEYRPNKLIGLMLNIAYDNRGAAFTGVTVAPCNCLATLATNLSYVSFEPSIRLAPFKSAFYVFAGPTIGMNITKEFTYTQQKQTDTKADWSNINKTVISAQAGAGIDIPLSKKASRTQMELSPFVSFQTDLGQSPRSVESWAIYTLRAGIALKFGTGKRTSLTKNRIDTITQIINTPMLISEEQIQFSVRAPKVVPLTRRIKETFPLRNSVFFDMGSTTIPARYELLSSVQAASFTEEKLQQDQPDNLHNGRAAREMTVYHNILNIIGFRLRVNPLSTILLIGSSNKNPVEGKLMAENIKQYFVTVFGIDANRIATEGRDKPVIPSEQPGATKELVLLREGDRRVDIESTSSELLMQVGGKNAPFLKPVQINAVEQDPLDSQVIFTAAGANDLLSSWSIDVTDEQRNVQHYGPYTQDQATVSGKVILGNNTQGNYKIVMVGNTKTGEVIRKESSISLMKMDDPKQEGFRYSILFDFNRFNTIASYENFLTDIVTPLITDNSTVIIHGHTDIIGDEKYNLLLSNKRAKDAQQIIENALLKTGRKGVKFDTYGFGKDAGMAPFNNTLPEERFYNRTVIIDIVPSK